MVTVCIPTVFHMEHGTFPPFKASVRNLHLWVGPEPSLGVNMKEGP